MLTKLLVIGREWWCKYVATKWHDALNFFNESTLKRMIRSKKIDALAVFLLHQISFLSISTSCTTWRLWACLLCPNRWKSTLASAFCRNIQEFCILFKDLTRHNYLKKGHIIKKRRRPWSFFRVSAFFAF